MIFLLNLEQIFVSEIYVHHKSSMNLHIFLVLPQRHEHLCENIRAALKIWQILIWNDDLSCKVYRKFYFQEQISFYWDKKIFKRINKVFNYIQIYEFQTIVQIFGNLTGDPSSLIKIPIWDIRKIMLKGKPFFSQNANEIEEKKRFLWAYQRRREAIRISQFSPHFDRIHFSEQNIPEIYDFLSCP